MVYVKKVSLSIRLSSLFFIFLPHYAISSQLLYEQRCTSCHSDKAEGSEASQAPAIAGLDKSYIVRQLNNFKHGIRGHKNDDSYAQAMSSIAQTISESEIRSLAQYIQSIPINNLIQENRPISLRGRGLYSGCSSCHGPNGEGNKNLDTPRISNQHIWYLKKQLEKFRSDLRGTDNKDYFGIQMNSMAKDIKGQDDIETLVNYISSLGK